MIADDFYQWLRQCSSLTPANRLRPLIMGVLNTTPNSFSDGGVYLDSNKACLRVLEMCAQGADIIDIGGEASNPGVLPISEDEELSRVIPVITAIRQASDVCISIDTYKPQVMLEAVAAGANCINDICALSTEGALSMAASLKVPVCLMHMKGTPLSMQQNANYDGDVVDEINLFLSERISACLAMGIPRERLIIDPGFGFGKTVRHNLTMLRRLDEFKQHQLPILLGVSRKNTIGVVLDKPINERLFGSLAVAVFAVQQGVNLIRTHDVDETYQSLRMINAILENE